MTDDMSQWGPFVEELCAALGLERDAVDIPRVLDLARDVARAAPRPMAPVSAYLVGCAEGRGLGSFEQGLDAVRATLGGLNAPAAAD